jgi:hypothetical protein
LSKKHFRHSLMFALKASVRSIKCEIVSGEGKTMYILSASFRSAGTSKN